MGLAGAGGSGADRPETYEIPNYSRHAHFIATGDDGHDRKNHTHNQRFEYVNINVTDRRLSNYTGDVSLINLVTPAEITAPPPPPPEPAIEKRGGLYFEHGYTAHTPRDIITAPGYENVDMDDIAEALVNNRTFELRMTAHADTSGDTAKNQTLSENRLNTAQALLVAALQRQGLSEQDARALYQERVAPHATIIAQGETSGPVTTQDGTRHQGNRVVSFDMIIPPAPVERPEGDVNKGRDMDNHEHLVIVNMGTARRQSEMHFYPEEAGRPQPGQVPIADEDVQFILRIDPDRNLNEAHQFTVNFWAKNNQVADNTTFLVESDQPGAVTSAYNFQTGKVDISLNGQVAASIYIRDHIDPAMIRVGQVSSQGQVIVSPLTNLADVEPLSEARRTTRDNNPLSIAADEIVQLSVDAKHLYMANSGERNQTAYQAALTQYGFTQKLDESLQPLAEQGVDTGPLRRLLTSQYTNPQSALYHPDQLVFPFQTFQTLYQAQINAGRIDPAQTQNPYDALVQSMRAEGTDTPDRTAGTPAATTAPGIRN